MFNRVWLRKCIPSPRLSQMNKRAQAHLLTNQNLAAQSQDLVSNIISTNFPPILELCQENWLPDEIVTVTLIAMIQSWDNRNYPNRDLTRKHITKKIRTPSKAHIFLINRLSLKSCCDCMALRLQDFAVSNHFHQNLGINIKYLFKYCQISISIWNRYSSCFVMLWDFQNIKYWNHSSATKKNLPQIILSILLWWITKC